MASRKKRKGRARLTPDNSALPQGIRRRCVLRGHTESIGKVAWSPDGTRLASPSLDSTVRVWDAATGAETARLETAPVGEEEKGDLISLAWAPDSRRMVVVDHLAGMFFWDGADPHADVRYFGTYQMNDVAWSPDGKWIAAAGYYPAIWLGNAETGLWVQDIGSTAKARWVVAWSPDSRYLVGGRESGGLDFYQAERNVINDLAGFLGSGELYSAAWSPQENLFAVGGSNGHMISVRLTKSAQSDTTFVGHNGGIIHITQPETGLPSEFVFQTFLEGHTGGINALSFSHDGRLLASNGMDGTARLWRTDTWEQVAVIATVPEGSPSIPLSLAFHPSQPLLVTPGSASSEMALWELDIDRLLGGTPVEESVRYATARVVLVGDSGVGKTGLGWRLASGAFKETDSTHGQQFWVVDALGAKRADGTECEAVVWDLAGQHVYRSVHAIFLENIDLALVLFDPSDRQDPLKGVEFWLEQLSGKKQMPPALLVGARIDRGSPVLSAGELDAFCQRWKISGGFVGVSAKTGEGLDRLTAALKEQIAWERMTATITTATFKRIKEFVLAIKAEPERANVLLSPAELEARLKADDPRRAFTRDEMLTAVRHLENHGYVIQLQPAAGEASILLAPELLSGLAASIILQAEKHPRELGAVNEGQLTRGEYPLPELARLEPDERPALLDGAVQRFLKHNLCFRETLGTDTLLIFPALIRQKRPLDEGFETVEDTSYIARGAVENVYAALAVLLGYTPTFTRVNHWQNQAQYEMGPGEICGFRQIEEREGEIELVLYYADSTPNYVRSIFQGLFEKFLYEHEVEVTRIPAVACPRGHRQERATVIRRIKEGREFLHCEECGERVDLPEVQQNAGQRALTDRTVRRESLLAELRSQYEESLAWIKSYRRDRAAPRVFLSAAAGMDLSELESDLQEAGVVLLAGLDALAADDYLMIIPDAAYLRDWRAGAREPGAAKSAVTDQLENARDGGEPRVLPLVFLDEAGGPVPRELVGFAPIRVSDVSEYVMALYEVVLRLYAVPGSHLRVEHDRRRMEKTWRLLTIASTLRVPVSDWSDSLEGTGVFINKRKLQDFLTARFTDGELELLCADVENDLSGDGVDLKVDLEAVGGETHPQKALRLVRYLDRRGFLDYLARAVDRTRGDFRS